MSLALHALHSHSICLQPLTSRLATPLQQPLSCKPCSPHTHVALVCSIRDQVTLHPAAASWAAQPDRVRACLQLCA